MNSLGLILIRHGETVENASNIVQGHHHGHLSEKGRKQAVKVAFRLNEEKFDAVYSSDLERAFHTARILMKEQKSLPIITDQRLREQNFGIYEGKPVISVLRQIRRQKADFTTFCPSNGEAPEDFRNRIKEFIGEVRSKHFGQTVVVVTHNGVINVILAVFSLLSPEERVSQNIFGNGAITILDIDTSGNVTVETSNCSEHLANTSNAAGT